MMPAEGLLAQTFLELADTLVADFDIVDFLHTLANRCSELFQPAEAGVMLADQRGGSAGRGFLKRACPPPRALRADERAGSLPGLLPHRYPGPRP